MACSAVPQGKPRPCDSAAASGYNDATQCLETIVCTSADLKVLSNAVTLAAVVVTKGQFAVSPEQPSTLPKQ